jgi:hypothetical protein
MSKVTKESFMDELAVFRDKNIPKIKGFYDQILVSSLLLQKFFYCAAEINIFRLRRMCKKWNELNRTVKSLQSPKKCD